MCAPGEREDEVCGDTDVGVCEYGTSTRTCNGSCSWSDWGECLGEVEPSTDTCGDGIDQDCDGMDDRRPDSSEPNDTCGQARRLFTEDAPVDPNVFVNATIDTAADQDDYYYFTAEDNTFTLGREEIIVTLEDVPGDADYDIYLYKGLGSCNNDDTLALSNEGTGQDERIEWTEIVNSDDSGDYYVRVKRYRGNACFAPYKLTVNGLN